MKKSYISPPSGTLDITIVRNNDPYVTLMLDLGIPNFTVFSLKMPIVQDRPASMTALLGEALGALLDEMSAFMLSMKFREEVIVRIYATVLATFQQMTPESTTDAGVSEVAKDNTVVTYEGSFQLPMDFVNETYNKVVTGSSILRRVPKVRHIELTVMKPTKIEESDVSRAIRQYKGRSIKNQPKPLYVVVYDQRGRPSGTLNLGPQFKNNLLKMMKGAAPAPQYTDTLTFANDLELKFKNAIGIPKSILMKSENMRDTGNEYQPEAFCGDDMALYTVGQDGKYLVKFPDGRVVKFTNRPSIKQLKIKNYPVPANYWRWTLIQESKPESIEEDHDNSDRTSGNGSGDQPSQDVLGETQPEQRPGS